MIWFLGRTHKTAPTSGFLFLSPFFQLVHVLNMMSAKILTYVVTEGETVADLQLRIEKDTNIPAANQELLLEAGLALEPHAVATQCAVDYSVILPHPRPVNIFLNIYLLDVSHGSLICVCRRWTDVEQICPWSSCSTAPPALMNPSLLLGHFLKIFALSVSFFFHAYFW